MKLGKVLGKFAALILITIFAVATMLASGTDWLEQYFGEPQVERDSGENLLVDRVLAPVSVSRINAEMVESVQSYAGTIRPFERLTLAFEIGGRIDSLGSDTNGRPFDDGSPVRRGDVLAQLDTRSLLAEKEELDALVQQAEAEMTRSEELKQKGAISQRDFVERETRLRVARAKAKLLDERLRDARLVAPTNGVIAKRLLTIGESVRERQAVFEIVQVDRVLLVVGVPESQIRPIIERWREVHGRGLRPVAATTPYPDENRFKVYVDLLGRTAFDGPWQRMTGDVHHISETSDDKSGLFEVEIEIPNDEGLLRPGQIATGALVVRRLQGFRIPAVAAIFEDARAYLYCVRPLDANRDDLYQTLDPAGEYRAHRIDLERGDFLEQGKELILPNLPVESRLVVVKGQHRLVPDALVKVAHADAIEPRDDAPARKGTDDTSIKQADGVKTSLGAEL